MVGKSTALFKSMNLGEKFQDIIGPLGSPTHLEKVGTVACVGGGTGVAVLHPITRGLKELGNHVIAIIGARTKDLLILEDKINLTGVYRPVIPEIYLPVLEELGKMGIRLTEEFGRPESELPSF